MGDQAAPPPTPPTPPPPPPPQYGYVQAGQVYVGLVALILAFFVSAAAAFFTSDEVVKLYERAGRPAP